jgi:glycerol kinase
MKKYVIALDQGTTSSRAIIFDAEQNIVGKAQKEFAQIYPKEGWVEHDPLEIYSSVYAVMMEAIALCDIRVSEIAAVGITNQRETTILWDRNTGRPIYNAIVWQCRRTSPIVDSLARGLAAEGRGDYIRETTGLVPDAYFSATKIKWILDNVEGAREKAEAGDILFGTVDSWLIWKFTSGESEAGGKGGAKKAVHATDYTNASRTMLFDIRALDWDDTLLTKLDIPRAMLPDVFPSARVYGVMNIRGEEIPIAGVAGDQQSALFGQCCFEKGEAKNTYGTGCFLLMNTGKVAVQSKNGLLTTIAAGTDDDVRYALEGSVFAGGSTIQWLRDEMRIISDAKDCEYFARKVPDNGGVYFVPAFTGLGSPYWDMYARGIIVGITRGTKQYHIVRAAEEAIAYQCGDLIAAMEKDAGERLPILKVDGGAARDSFLLQFQADISARPVRRSATNETTALGAASLAGLGVGFWKNGDELRAMWKSDRDFFPEMDDKTRARLVALWNKAVARSRSWEEVK